MLDSAGKVTPFLSVLWSGLGNYTSIFLRWEGGWEVIQKQSFKDIIVKRCSENMQRIIHTPEWVFSHKFFAYF